MSAEHFSLVCRCGHVVHHHCGAPYLQDGTEACLVCNCKRPEVKSVRRFGGAA